MTRITRESYDALFENISWLFTICDNEDDISVHLEILLKDEGLIEIIEESEEE